jgi:DNA-binding response OmpR family regulator
MGFDRKKILVVDDDDLIRGLISKMLSRFGYDVLSVDSGDKGWDLFLKNQFDLVITDFEMPGMNGFDLADHIKKKSPYTAVILMTGQAKAATLARLTKSSVDQALFKPFGMQEMETTIQTMLNS